MQKRQTEQHQDREGGQGREQRTPPCQRGDPTHRAELPGARIVAPSRHRPPLDPSAEQDQQCRQHHERPSESHRHDRHPGEGERTQEVLREHQQAAQGCGNGGGAEQNGPAGAAHGHVESGDRVMADAVFLPVAGDEQQAVVNGESEAERGREVDREHRHVHDGGQRSQHAERADDRKHADKQRYPRRDRRREHHQ